MVSRNLRNSMFLLRSYCHSPCNKRTASCRNPSSPLPDWHYDISSYHIVGRDIYSIVHRRILCNKRTASCQIRQYQIFGWDADIPSCHIDGINIYLKVYHRIPCITSANGFLSVKSPCVALGKYVLFYHIPCMDNFSRVVRTLRSNMETSPLR